MKTIWKYELFPVGSLSMPKGAKILAIQTQRDSPMLWVLVDPSAPLEERKFHIYGTGHNVPDSPGEYRGTFQLGGGSLVFHVFEED